MGKFTVYYLKSNIRHNSNLSMQHKHANVILKKFCIIVSAGIV